MPTTPKTTRKEEVKELPRAKGPMSKSIKEGRTTGRTVSYVLNDGETFQNVDGKWSLKEGETRDDVSKESKSQEAPF